MVQGSRKQERKMVKACEERKEKVSKNKCTGKTDGQRMRGKEAKGSKNKGTGKTDCMEAKRFNE